MGRFLQRKMNIYQFNKNVSDSGCACVCVNRGVKSVWSVSNCIIVPKSVLPEQHTGDDAFYTLCYYRVPYRSTGGGSFEFFAIKKSGPDDKQVREARRGTA